MGKRSRRGQGEGAVFYLANRDRWCAEIDYGYVGGTRKRQRRSFKSRKEASSWLTTALKAKSDGAPPPDGRTKLGDFCSYWLAEIVEPSDRRAATKASYEAAIRLHIKPALGHHKLIDLRHEHVQSFVNDRRRAGCGRSLMNTTMVVLRMVLKQAIVEERITKNVAVHVAVPDGLVRRHSPRRLSPEERTKLLRAVASDRLFGLYFVLATFGLRRGEALGIRLEDADIPDKSLRVNQQIVRITGQGLVAQPPKRGSGRSLYLSERSIAVIESRLAARAQERLAAEEAWIETGLLFTTLHGTPLDPARLNHHMAAMCRTIGIPHAAPHSLRRAFADLAHDGGVRDKELQAAMGHAHLSTTMDTYVAQRRTTDADFAAIVDGSLDDISGPLADNLPDTLPRNDSAVPLN